VALLDAESIDDPTVIRFNESRQKQPNFYEVLQTGTPVALVLLSTWEKRFFFGTLPLPLVSFSQQQKQHKNQYLSGPILIPTTTTITSQSNFNPIICCGSVSSSEA
jgi:hypothetical protein